MSNLPITQLSYEPLFDAAMLTIRAHTYPPGTLIFVDIGSANLEEFRNQVMSAQLPPGVFILLSKGDDPGEARFDFATLSLDELPDNVLQAAGLVRIAERGIVDA